MIHPLSTELVPLPQSMQLPANQGAEATPRQGRAGKIGMHLVPGVSHRGMHVADMQLLWAGEHTLGHKMAAADHKLRCTQIDLLDGEWQQRQILLHMAAAPWQVLNRAGQDGSALQPTARPTGFRVNEGGQLRFAAEVSQEGINLFNNLLCTSNRAGREPLVHQGDALGEVIRGGGHPAGVKRTLRSLSANCRTKLGSRCWSTCPARTSPSTSSSRRR